MTNKSVKTNKERIAYYTEREKEIDRHAYLMKREKEIDNHKQRK